MHDARYWHNASVIITKTDGRGQISSGSSPVSKKININRSFARLWNFQAGCIPEHLHVINSLIKRFFNNPE